MQVCPDEFQDYLKQHNRQSLIGEINLQAGGKPSL